MKLPFSVLIFSVFLFIYCAKSNAQYNYVNNPSFEEYDSLPLYYPDSTLYTHNYFALGWFNPVSCGFLWYRNELLNSMDTAGGSPISSYGVPQNPWDYCWPVEGHAYAFMNIYMLSGLPEGYRMYLETMLKSPLIAGTNYCLNFYITLIDSAQISIDQIGAYFSSDTLENYTGDECDSCYLNVMPHIVSPPGEFFDTRNKWYQISGIYHATGGERFLTIGNFKGPGMTNYIWVPDCGNTYAPGAAYEVDMVTLIECDTTIKSAFAGKDTSICLGDSVQLGLNDTLNGYSFEWIPGIWLNDSSIQNPSAIPQETITYYFQQRYYNNYLTTDEITITVIDCNEPLPDTTDALLFIPNIFTPNGDGSNEVFYVRGEQIKLITFSVYNRWGATIFETNDPHMGWDGQLQGKDCAAGVYFYVAEVTFENGAIEVRKGSVTLVR